MKICNEKTCVTYFQLKNQTGTVAWQYQEQRKLKQQLVIMHGNISLERVKVDSDMTSHKALRHRWYNVVMLNVHTSAENRVADYVIL